MTTLLYDHSSRPPLGLSILLGFQHLLVLFGGVVTAPLIVALALGLPAEDVRYLISSSLFISGVATLLQIQRFGYFGSGLLSVQGTSFTFIGPLIFCFFMLNAKYTAAESMGILMGSSALCALIICCLCPFIHRITRFITTNVSGATVLLIGMTLVWTTLTNLWGIFTAADTAQPLWQRVMMALIPMVCIVGSFLINNAWVRMLSICLALFFGYLFALAVGAVDFSGLADLPLIFIPELGRYPLGIDPVVVGVLLPVFLLSMSESIGDFTVTSALSGLSVGGKDYWTRIRGGLLADAFNSFLAAIFSIFPNTTFSQNNGVIRLTGVASPYVGRFTAVFLIILGGIPLVGGLFQTLPAAVLFGATLLMFAMVGLSGVRIVQMGAHPRRDWLIVGFAVIGGYTVANITPLIPGVYEPVRMLMQYPVSMGVVIAVIMELIVPPVDDPAAAEQSRVSSVSAQ